MDILKSFPTYNNSSKLFIDTFSGPYFPSTLKQLLELFSLSQFVFICHITYFPYCLLIFFPLIFLAFHLFFLLIFQFFILTQPLLYFTLFLSLHLYALLCYAVTRSNRFTFPFVLQLLLTFLWFHWNSFVLFVKSLGISFSFLTLSIISQLEYHS